MVTVDPHLSGKTKLMSSSQSIIFLSWRVGTNSCVLYSFCESWTAPRRPPAKIWAYFCADVGGSWADAATSPQQVVARLCEVARVLKNLAELPRRELVCADGVAQKEALLEVFSLEDLFHQGV